VNSTAGTDPAGSGVCRLISTPYKALLFAPGAPKRREAFVNPPNTKNASALIHAGPSFGSTQRTCDVESSELPLDELFHSLQVEPDSHLQMHIDTASANDSVASITPARQSMRPYVISGTRPAAAADSGQTGRSSRTAGRHRGHAMPAAFGPRGQETQLPDSR